MQNLLLEHQLCAVASAKKAVGLHFGFCCSCLVEDREHGGYARVLVDTGKEASAMVKAVVDPALEGYVVAVCTKCESKDTWNHIPVNVRYMLTSGEFNVDCVYNSAAKQTVA